MNGKTFAGGGELATDTVIAANVEMARIQKFVIATSIGVRTKHLQESSREPEPPQAPLQKFIALSIKSTAIRREGIPHSLRSLGDGEPNAIHDVDDPRGRNIGACTRAARRGGRVVGFGFLAVPNLPSMFAMFVELYAGSRLRGRTGSFYGITLEYRRKPQLFHEDLPKIFALVSRGAISPLIAATFPLLDARKAVELLASGSVAGKIVLTNPATGDR